MLGEGVDETSGKSGKKQVVLVVDDYADGREMYQEYLEFMGYEVVVAKDGADALEKARAEHPDIILMDLSLPILNGLDATRALKAGTDTSDIPVVALTGHVMKGSSDDALSAGCDDFLAKPALPDDVEAKIRKLLGGSKLRPATLLNKKPKE